MSVHITQIKKEDVDRFPLEGTLCECQLFIHWESKLQEPAELQYRVDLLGAKPPKDYFDIVLDSILTGMYHISCIVGHLFMQLLSLLS